MHQARAQMMGDSAHPRLRYSALITASGRAGIPRCGSMGFRWLRRSLAIKPTQFLSVRYVENCGHRMRAAADCVSSRVCGFTTVLFHTSARLLALTIARGGVPSQIQARCATRGKIGLILPGLLFCLSSLASVPKSWLLNLNKQTLEEERHK